MRELELYGSIAGDSGTGWVRCSSSDPGGAAGVSVSGGLCFPVLSLWDVCELAVSSVNGQAAGVCECFWDGFRGEGIAGPWPVHFTGTADQALSTRVGTVRREVLRRLRRQAPRVAGLATDSLPDAAVPVRGLAVYFVDFASLVVSTRFCYWGQRRMRDDRRAPSRSYLKVEEAYAVLGEAPSRGQRVADLGAAPGGWSYSAAERGAEVIAVDNGPLKGGALGHPRITHLRADAFRFRADRPFDWLFCDLIESPERVLREILVRWLEQRLCRAFIVNLKVGKADPLRLLRELRSDRSDGLVGLCERLCIRQLYHDRDEITCMGIALSGR